MPPVYPLLIRRLHRNGIVYPLATVRAARAAKVGLPLACAILMQETGGGHNEFGHDPTIAVGWGEVTEGRYRAYLKLRTQSGLVQGVGSCQLTSASLQDEADRAGGCWIPQHNIAVGLHYLHDLIVEHHDVTAGVAAYNGSGPAAARYAARVLTLAHHFKAARCGTLIGTTG
jgi:hypothetical protein